jgi:hypothetical protein
LVAIWIAAILQYGGNAQFINIKFLIFKIRHFTIWPPGAVLQYILTFQQYGGYFETV